MEYFEDSSVWTALTDAGGISTETTTFIQGAASLSFDKIAGTQIGAAVLRLVNAPWDLQALISGHTSPTLNYFVNLATTASVDHAEFDIIYELDVAGIVIVKADRYNLTGLSTGWNRFTGALDSPTSEVGGPLTDQDRRHVIGYAARIVMTSGAATISNVIFDAAVLSGGSLLSFDGIDIIVPRFDRFDVNFNDSEIINPAEEARELVFISAHTLISFGWRTREELKSGFVSGLHEGLRRFGHYIKANVDWTVAKNSRELINTTVDAASGRLQTDPRRLNVASTVEIEFLTNASPTGLGLTDIEILVGPNTLRRWEIGIIKDSTWVTSTSHVILQSGLANNYVNTDRVRSRNFFPVIAIDVPGNPMVETPDGWTFAVTAGDY